MWVYYCFFKVTFAVTRYFCHTCLDEDSNESFESYTGGGDNGYGSGVVTSLKTFDREQRKEYQLPIIIRDSGSPPMSGTNTLTIVIGDVNDNRHHPAHKDILVYSYRGTPR